MPISDLDNIVSSVLLDQSNYDTSNARFLDASKFSNHLELKTGVPVWEMIGGTEGLDLDNQFYFEFENYPCIPKGSSIYAVNINSNAADGLLNYMQWFFGKEVAGDHAVTSYDPATDPFDTSIRDQAFQCFGNNVRTFDGQGGNVGQSVVADDWVIVTSVIELLPVKIRQALNGGAFSESFISPNYAINTFGNIFRVGQLNDTGGTPSASSVRLGEFHFFQGDVSQQAGYSSVISELKTKYGIA